MAATVGTAMLVSGIIGGVASAAGSTIAQSKAAGKATKAQTQANDAAMAMERDNELRRREEFDRVESANKIADEIERRREQQRYDTSLLDSRRNEAQQLAIREQDERRKEPYRAAGRGALEELSKLAGITIRPSAAPPSMTGGWTPDMLSTPTSQAPSMADLARTTGRG